MSAISVEDLMVQSEALIFASDRPLSEADITSLLKSELGVKKSELKQLPEALEQVCSKYKEGQFPFEIVHSGGGYQFLSKSHFFSLIAKLNGKKFKKRLSTAAMETLAIIAYKQPCTKADIEYVRGVNADYAVQKLLELELVAILGRKEDAIGKPLLYGTSHSFMDHLGINSLEELPQLNEINANESVEPSAGVSESVQDSTTQMVVREDGALEEIAFKSEDENIEQDDSSHPDSATDQ